MLDTNNTKIYTKLYDAALEAIAETGDAYKGLSWFAKNKPEFEKTLIGRHKRYCDYIKNKVKEKE